MDSNVPKIKQSWFDQGQVNRALSTPQDELFRQAHEHSDVDFEIRSLHHTLGTGPTQAARGDHKHGAGVTDGSGIGQVVITAGTTLWANHMWCDGAALDRIAFKLLFDEIGTRYGAGDGATTFNIPDTRKRSMRGTVLNTDVPTSDGLAVGARSSTAPTVALSNAGSHSHSNGYHSHGIPLDGTHGHTGASLTDGGHSHSVTTSAVGDHTHTISGQNTGSAITAATGSGQSNINSFGNFSGHAHGGATGSNGGHSHGGNTNADTGHSHGLNINSVGNHDHSGTNSTATSTDNSGSHTHIATVTGGDTPWLDFNVMIKYQ